MNTRFVVPVADIATCEDRCALEFTRIFYRTAQQLGPDRAERAERDLDEIPGTAEAAIKAYHLTIDRLRNGAAESQRAAEAAEARLRELGVKLDTLTI